MTKMKLFKSKITAALLALGLVASVAAVPVLAATEPNTDADTEATVTFEGGELSLVSAPEDLDFETQTITNVRESYKPASVGGALVVSDLRGNLAGWSVTAQLSAFVHENATGDDTTLEGSSISFKNVEVSALNNTTGTTPTVKDVELFSGGASAKVLTAPANTGGGVWSAALNRDGTSLTVLPGTAQTGTSDATITWTLHDAP